MNKESVSKLKHASKYCEIYVIRKAEYDKRQEELKEKEKNGVMSEEDLKSARRAYDKFMLEGEELVIYNKGLKIFNELVGRLMPNKVRFEAFLGLLKYAPDDGFMDKLSMIRDSLQFLNGEALNKEIELLEMLIREPSINGHDRYMCVLTLFNIGMIVESQRCFESLSKDTSAPFMIRVDCCRYLIFNEDEKCYDLAKNILRQIIDDKNYKSEKRYDIIASFNSKTGLSSVYNKDILYVDYKEDLIYELQKIFFFNNENDVKSRILSGGCLLGLSLTIPEEKEQIINELVNIGMRYTNLNKEEKEKMNKDEIQDLKNICADSADKILSLGNSDQKLLARKILDTLRLDNNTVDTIYNDQQNVHNETITEAINNFIEKILLKTEEKISSYEDVIAEINDMIYKSTLNAKDKNTIFKALHRISIDTATFTSYNITSVELLIHIWMRIKSHESSTELKKRFMEELLDTSTGFCASGMAGKMINCLSGFYGNLTMNWADQIQANTFARIQSRIKSVKDEEEQTSIIMGMTEKEGEDREIYMKFLRNNINDVYDELRKEFIEYIKENEFEGYFRSGLTKWGINFDDFKQ